MGRKKKTFSLKVQKKMYFLSCFLSVHQNNEVNQERECDMLPRKLKTQDEKVNFRIMIKADSKSGGIGQV